MALLGERSAITGFTRQGTASCGGAARLLRAADGWFALTLARSDDVDLVPAWLQRDDLLDATWATISGATIDESAGELVDRGRLLGLPIAGLGDTTPAGAPKPRTRDSLPIRATRLAEGPATLRLDDVLVADLSALWAGPLCGSILASAGADVVKVESSSRPDGARSGHRAFFNLLNAGKRGFATDFRTNEGVRALRHLLERADVVIEGSRPRALEQFGIDVRALVTRSQPRVWVSITGYGRTDSERDWVAFGDDAAVAAGLVAWDCSGPNFCADAIADPCTGIVAAAATLDALSVGGQWLLDVPMTGVAAHLAGPTLPRTKQTTAPAPPRHRTVDGIAPVLGEHTREVLDVIGFMA